MGILPDAQGKVSHPENGEWLLSTAHPQCIERDSFLLFSTAKVGGQDYWMKQPQKTLAYTKALQLWV